jgi:hypothetical protein
LTITAGASELTITRALTRATHGAKQVRHDAEVRIARPGRPDEVISAIAAVNDCILRELNGLDSTVLRNSCLMEQQALDRIETLSAANREMAIAKLLGIDAIQNIEQELRVTRKDETHLETARLRLEVARTAERARQAGETASQAALALQAAQAAAALAARDNLAEQLQQNTSDLDAVTRERARLGDRLRRVEILEALQARGEANEHLLRVAEQETAALAVLQAGQGAAPTAAEIAAASERVATLRQLEAELVRATEAHNTAGTSAQLAQAETEVATAQALEQTQQTQLATTRKQARRNGLLALAAVFASLALFALSILTPLHWLNATAIGLLLLSIALLVRGILAQRTAANQRARLATLARETTELRATAKAMQRLGVGTDRPAGDSPEATATRQALEDAEARAHALGIEPNVTAVTAERIAAERTAVQLTGAATATPESLLAQRQRATQAHDETARALSETATALTDAGIAIPAQPQASATVADLRRVHEAMRQPLQAELARLDLAEAQRQRGTLDAREQQLRGSAETLRVQRDDQRQRLASLLAERGIATTGDERGEALLAQWPELATAGDPAELTTALASAEAVAGQLAQQMSALCQQHGFDADTLDPEACQDAYDEMAEALRQRRLAAEMADEVFKRIVQRVLPETEMHMRALLPELTDGRYRDVTLLSDDDSADLRIRVWDEQAGRYVGKHLFSGGTRDQCSLALRLAFALATLPKELGAMPGFIFLDEPLSSFDDRRSQALVDVLTHGPIARQFPQVFLISHSQSFDPAAFTCSLRMAGGRVSASSLPDERAAAAMWQTNIAAGSMHPSPTEIGDEGEVESVTP